MNLCSFITFPNFSFLLCFIKLCQFSMWNWMGFTLDQTGHGQLGNQWDDEYYDQSVLKTPDMFPFVKPSFIPSVFLTAILLLLFSSTCWQPWLPWWWASILLWQWRVHQLWLWGQEHPTSLHQKSRSFTVGNRLNQSVKEADRECNVCIHHLIIVIWNTT